MARGRSQAEACRPPSPDLRRRCLRVPTKQRGTTAGTCTDWTSRVLLLPARPHHRLCRDGHREGAGRQGGDPAAVARRHDGAPPPAPPPSPPLAPAPALTAPAQSLFKLAVYQICASRTCAGAGRRRARGPAGRATRPDFRSSCAARPSAGDLRGLFPPEAFEYKQVAELQSMASLQVRQRAASRQQRQPPPQQPRSWRAPRAAARAASARHFRTGLRGWPARARGLQGWRACRGAAPRAQRNGAPAPPPPPPSRPRSRLPRRSAATAPRLSRW